MTADPSPADQRRHVLLGACLVAMPLALLASTGLFVAGAHFSWAVTSQLWLLLAYGAVLAIVHLLRERADRIGLAGGVLCFIGLTGGTGIVTLFKIVGVLERTDPTIAETVLETSRALPLLPTIFPPGLGYPIGLLLLATGLYRARHLPAWLAATLALGAVLFPIGRIPHIEAAYIASDVLVAVALLALARRAWWNPGA